jgi:hypothetical protein
MTSRQLIDFVEDKLKQHGIQKVIPNSETLASTYQMFAASDRLSEEFEELRQDLQDETERRIEVPDDLEAKVKDQLQQHPDISWHRAVRLIIDPDAPDDKDDEADDGEAEDDEDQSDVGE